MRKLFVSICFVFAIFLCGCKKTELPTKTETTQTTKETDSKNVVTEEEETQEEEMDQTEETVTNIDWTDFVQYFDQVYENNQTIVPEEEIEEEIGEVKGNPPSVIEGEEYITQNGEAGWLPSGTKLYSIKNLDSINYIAVYFEGQYIFYKTAESESVKFEESEEKKEPRKVTKNERIYLTEAAGYESIYKLQKEYTISLAEENGDYVAFGEPFLNTEKIIDFLNNVGNKEAAMVRKVTMTIEGGIIITDYIYNGESFRVVMDDTRDKFSDKPQTKEKNFAYLKVCEEENGSYIVLTNDKSEEERNETCILLNEQEMEEYDGIHLLKLKEK